MKKAKLKAVRKVRNKDLVLPFRMDHDFFARMALLGQLHHIDIKVAFTLKTALRAPELFLCLLPILRDSRERQAKPNSPNSLTFVRLVPKSAPGEGYSETRSREPFFTL